MKPRLSGNAFHAGLQDNLAQPLLGLQLGYAIGIQPGFTTPQPQPLVQRTIAAAAAPTKTATAAIPPVGAAEAANDPAKTIAAAAAPTKSL